MSFVLGAGGPLSALTLMGQTYPGWLLLLWTIALGVLGILLAVSLRNKLIVVEDLPFPTGTATAEVIETIHAARHSALHRARLLEPGRDRVDVRRLVSRRAAGPDPADVGAGDHRRRAWPPRA